MAELTTLGDPIAIALGALTGDERGALLLALVGEATPQQREAVMAALGATPVADAVVSADVDVIRVMTRAQHEALATPDERTWYALVG